MGRGTASRCDIFSLQSKRVGGDIERSHLVTPWPGLANPGPVKSSASKVIWWDESDMLLVEEGGY